MAGTTEKRDRRDLSHIYQGMKKCPEIAGDPKTLLDDYEKWETFVAKLGLSTWKDYWETYDVSLTEEGRARKILDVEINQAPFCYSNYAGRVKSEDYQFLNLYRLFRAYMFEKSSLDPREPETQVNAKWRQIVMPDSWTWIVLDSLVILDLSLIHI